VTSHPVGVVPPPVVLGCELTTRTLELLVFLKPPEIAVSPAAHGALADVAPVKLTERMTTAFAPMPGGPCAPVSPAGPRAP